MDLSNKYIKIKQKMNKINYDNLWPNFHQHKFALYDNSNVCFEGKILPKTDEFIANTSIKFQDEMFGIWNLQNDIDDDILTSKLIHETFHAFQNENKESRYPNEIEALIKYKYEVKNLSLKMMENNLIVKLVESFNYDDFNQLIKIRKRRMQLFPYETNYELLIEQIEGTANFVELESLKQLNYEKYLVKLNQMKQEIVNVNNLFPIRIVSYDIGALLIKILNDNNLAINCEFNDQYYLDFYLKSYDSGEFEVEDLFEVKTIIENFYAKTKMYIDNSVKKENLVLKGEFELLGVNVYNARFMDNYIITTYFLMYKEDDNEKILNGDFIVKLNDKLMISEVYKLIK